MDDLVQFLHARYDDDATLARDADNRDSDWWWGPNAESAAERHIARHNPERVLADVDAKRRILLLHNIPAVVSPKMAAFGLRDGEKPEDDRRCAGCGLDRDDDPIVSDVSGCPILRALALPYADHPDYREEWRPST